MLFDLNMPCQALDLFTFERIDRDELCQRIEIKMHHGVLCAYPSQGREGVVGGAGLAAAPCNGSSASCQLRLNYSA